MNLADCSLGMLKLSQTMRNAMVENTANNDASGNLLNAVEIWLGYFLIAAKTMIYSRKRIPRILK